MALRDATLRPRRPGLGTYAGLFGVTLATLDLEIALTRIFSVTMWYHFAFVAISVALFGVTAGALIVHLLPDRFRDAQVRERLWVFALLFGITTVVCFAIQLAIPFTPKLTLAGAASVVGTCVLVAIPFVFSGVVVCLALTRFPGRVNRLYAVDLVGGGLGCALVVILLSWIDGPSAIVLVGAFATAAACAFAADARSRRGVVLAGVATLLLGGFALVNSQLFTDGRPLLKILWVKEQRDTDHDYQRWNAFSRLTLDFDRSDPTAAGLIIDGTAGTKLNRYTGDSRDSDHLRNDIQNLPHYIRHDADVFVIGVGGGSDVLSALEFGQRSVTGLEMNGDILDIAHHEYADFTGHLADNPKVELVNDEARSYLARTERQYDLIQISLIDTWAATGAGAFALTENSLYTTEAWNLFLDRLQPGGILDVTRFYKAKNDEGKPIQPVETYRAVALAAKVLKERGVARPRDHLVIYRVPTPLNVDLATLLVSRDPFSQADLRELSARARELGFTTLLTPNGSTDAMLSRLTAPAGPDAAVDDVSADISPPTDNRPFFFQMADLDTFRDGGITRDDFVTRPVLILAGLAFVVLALAAACIAFPLALSRRTGDAFARRRFVPFYVYFAGIGLGFLLIEVAQLQRLSIFLGHPTYGLSVVLFSVLVFSGIGSLLTERFLRPERAVTLVVPLAALVALLAVVGLVTPGVLHATDAATTPGRIAIAVALLAPPALLMGMPFALGMRSAAAAPGTPHAFLWAINGATSVCASVLGVVIAVFLGISAAFWAGVAAYVLALAAMVVIGRGLGLAAAPPPAPSDAREDALAAGVG